jgi:hypothetical protein
MCRCATWAVALEPANQNELLNVDEEHWLGEHWKGPQGALNQQRSIRLPQVTGLPSTGPEQSRKLCQYRILKNIYLQWNPQAYRSIPKNSL